MKGKSFTSVLRVGFLIFLGIGSLTLGQAKEQESENVSRTVAEKKTVYDFDALQIEGELKSPGEFYFQVKPEEKMDSLIKRRKNFHRQMLRDVMFSK